MCREHMKVLLYTVFKERVAEATEVIPSRLNSAGKTRMLQASSHTI